MPRLIQLRLDQDVENEIASRYPGTAIATAVRQYLRESLFEGGEPIIRTDKETLSDIIQEALRGYRIPGDMTDD